MSATTSATHPGPMAPPAGPPMPDLSAIFAPAIDSLMIGHTFLTLLLPLLIALFYYSTPQGRRRPIFILNVIAIILAFVVCVMVDASSIHTILSLEDPWPLSVNIAIGLIGTVMSILVDTILLVRLTSVHPLSHVGLARFVTLTFLPVLLKIARIVNLIIFTKVLAVAGRGPLGPQNIAIVWASTPYLKIEWSCQMVDNAYASLAFFWTIRDRGNGHGVTSNIHPTRVTFAQRIRTLSRIALSNFIIPSLFSIAQLVVVYRNVNVLIVNEIIFVNTLVAVFGVVFATVWAGNISRREAEQWESTSAGGSPVTMGNDNDNGGVAKRHPRTFNFPGLGSWHVASSPRTLTFGSTRYTGPTDDVTASAGASGGFDPEKGNGQGVFVAMGSASGSGSLGSGSLEVKAGEEDTTKPRALSTPSY